MNPTPWAETGDYWLVRQDPVTIRIDLPFRPTGRERERLEARIRQSLGAAEIRDLAWGGHRVRVDVHLPPGTHQLALGGIEGLERQGLDRVLWLERTQRYDVVAWRPASPAASDAETVTQLDLPTGAEGVGPVVAERDFLLAGGDLQGPADRLRTIWSWTPGTQEALPLPGAYPVNIARWIGEDRLWVRHEIGLIVDTAAGTAEPVDAADVAVHPDGRTALFHVAREDGDTWPWTWHWRLAVKSPAGQVVSRWELFTAGGLEVVPRLETWWGPDGITFTTYITDAGDIRWWLAVVDPDTGDMRTLAGPAVYVSGLGGGQYLLAGESGEAPAPWRIWRPGTGLTDVTQPAELHWRVPAPRVHSLWGEWMVLYVDDAADPHVARPVVWRVNSDEWLELGPVQPLGWYEGTFYWLRAQGWEP